MHAHLMIEVLQTDVFVRNRIVARLDRAASGNFGDWKSVGGGVSEMRIAHGPGYRVYFTRRGSRMIIILAGGTKRTQDADIRRATEMAAELEG